MYCAVVGESRVERIVARRNLLGIIFSSLFLGGVLVLFRSWVSFLGLGLGTFGVSFFLALLSW